MVRAAFSSGWGKRFWKGATGLEVFKFALYVSLPVMSSIFYANPEFMQAAILRLRLVEYPQAATPPPVGDEIEVFRAKIKQQKKKAE